ncbi:MAG: hypothetical protein ACOC5T_09475 [Elusimicrobiota bacterium]
MFSASINVLTPLPANLIAGSQYTLKYDICLNTAQDFWMEYEVINYSSEFINSQNKTPIYIKNCTRENQTFICNFTGIQGSNIVNNTLVVELLASNFDFRIKGFLKLNNEEEYGVCKARPAVNPIPAGSTSGGGSFSSPRPAPIKEEPKKQEEEPQEPKIQEEEQEPQEPEVILPKPIQKEPISTSKPSKPTPAQEIEFDPHHAEDKKEIDWTVPALIILSFGVILGLCYYIIKQIFLNKQV